MKKHFLLIVFLVTLIGCASQKDGSYQLYIQTVQGKGLKAQGGTFAVDSFKMLSDTSVVIYIDGGKSTIIADKIIPYSR